MPDFPRHDDRAQHHRSDLPPPGPPSDDPAERFAEALDAFVLGMLIPETGDATDPTLTRLTTARRIQRRHGSRMTASGPQSATPIGQARKQQIWENLMAQHAHAPAPANAPTAHPSTVGRLAALMQPWVAIDDERPGQGRRASTGLLRFVPDLQPVTTFALVIAVLIAIGAAFSTIVDPGTPGVTPTASAEGLTGIAGQTGPATPDSAATAPAATIVIPPTADMLDQFHQPIPTGVGACTVAPRPSSQIDAFFQDPGPTTPRAYLPAIEPHPFIANVVAMAGRTYLACERAGVVNTDRALQTGRFIYEDPTNGHFRAAGGATDLATREEQQQLVTLALGEDYRSNLFLVSDQAVSQEEYDAAVAANAPLSVPSDLIGTPEVVLPEQINATFLPAHAVQLADGRVAIPEIQLVNPADIDAWVAAGDDINPDLVAFYIFGPDPTGGDQWMLDERLYACPDSDLCADYYAQVDQYNQASDALFPPATPSATPSIAPIPARPTSASTYEAIIPLPGLDTTPLDPPQPTSTATYGAIVPLPGPSAPSFDPPQPTFTPTYGAAGANDEELIILAPGPSTPLIDTAQSTFTPTDGAIVPLPDPGTPSTTPAARIRPGLGG